MNNSACDQKNTTKLYMAPMEEITGYIFRNVQNEMFGYVDKYFSPFITPTESMKLKPREIKDILDSNNEGLYLVPQLLTNDSELFIKGVELLMNRGYFEINLNLGCPSNTVAKKGKGSGFLAFPEELDRFFENVFKRLSDDNIEVDISVKTRLGMHSEEEFDSILPIFNRYPISELIVHPRVKDDMYSNYIRMEKFDLAYKNSKSNIVYNGDIYTYKDAINILSKYPNCGLMMGRGAVANPGIFREIVTGKKITNSELLEFHDKLYNSYAETLGVKDAFFKMKEVWNNMQYMFDNDKLSHKIRICKEPDKMMELAHKMISEEEIIR